MIHGGTVSILQASPWVLKFVGVGVVAINMANLHPAKFSKPHVPDGSQAMPLSPCRARLEPGHAPLPHPWGWATHPSQLRCHAPFPPSWAKPCTLPPPLQCQAILFSSWGQVGPRAMAHPAGLDHIPPLPPSRGVGLSLLLPLQGQVQARLPPTPFHVVSCWIRTTIWPMVGPDTAHPAHRGKRLSTIALGPKLHINTIKSQLFHYGVRIWPSFLSPHCTLFL